MAEFVTGSRLYYSIETCLPLSTAVVPLFIQNSFLLHSVLAVPFLSACMSGFLEP